MFTILNLLRVSLALACSAKRKGEGRCALHTGSMCRKTIIGGGLARQLGWHVQTPRRAHLCHHFPHGLRRCGVVGSTLLRRSGLFVDDDAGARERGRISENGARYHVEQTRGERRACLARQQKVIGSNENWGTTDALGPLSRTGLHNFFTHRSGEIAALRPLASFSKEGSA